MFFGNPTIKRQNVLSHTGSRGELAWCYRRPPPTALKTLFTGLFGVIWPCF